FEDDIRNLLLCIAPLQKLCLMLGVGTTLRAEYLLEIICHFTKLYEIVIKLAPICALEDTNFTFAERWDSHSVKRVTIIYEAEPKNPETIHQHVSFNFIRCLPSVERVHIKHQVIC